MSFAIPAAIGAVGSIYAANKQAGATKSAAKQALKGQQDAIQAQRDALAEQRSLQQPYSDLGRVGVNALTQGFAPGGQFATPFSQTNFQQDPGYQFRLNEGMKALNQQAAARQGLQSGAALKAAQRYGQDLGSQEYQNAFNRYYTERQQMMNPLFSLTDLGARSAGIVGGNVGQYGTNAGNLITQGAADQGNALMARGQARASQYGGVANALGQALGSQGGQNALSSIFGGPAVPAAPVPQVAPQWNSGYDIGNGAGFGY